MGEVGLNQEVPFVPMLLTLRRTVAGSPFWGMAQIRGWDQRCNVKPGLDEQMKKKSVARSNERATLTSDVDRRPDATRQTK